MNQDSLQGPDLSLQLTNLCLSLKFKLDVGRVKFSTQLPELFSFHEQCHMHASLDLIGIALLELWLALELLKTELEFVSDVFDHGQLSCKLLDRLLGHQCCLLLERPVVRLPLECTFAPLVFVLVGVDVHSNTTAGGGDRQFI